METAAGCSHSGLFRIGLHSLNAKLDLETDARSFTASLEVAWEPHLLPLLLETRPSRPSWSATTPASSSRPARSPVPWRPWTAATTCCLRRDVASVNRGACASLSLLEGELYAVGTKMLRFDFDFLDQLDKAPPGDPRLDLMQEGVSCRIGKIVQRR